MMFANRGKYIWFVTQYDMSIWESLLDSLESYYLIMYWISSFSWEDSQVSSYHYSHLICQILCLREIVLMSRMKKIESSEAHHMYHGVLYFIINISSWSHIDHLDIEDIIPLCIDDSHISDSDAMISWFSLKWLGIDEIKMSQLK